MQISIISSANLFRRSPFVVPFRGSNASSLSHAAAGASGSISQLYGPLSPVMGQADLKWLFTLARDVRAAGLAPNKPARSIKQVSFLLLSSE
ncbi:hypothetical protein [Novosphingobium sp. Rr 2-17]|uniref:hypothetical protein n=1 Tax=Novosphingobium sp. Rr 2-17 TaxID=555793 RepID=UPI001ED94D97|nr:hypothetical protein [Novosphingobium sp. Rr 2-17]